MSPCRFLGLPLLVLTALGCARPEPAVSDADLQSATLETTSVNYFGGMTVSTSFTADEVRFERRFPAITGKPPLQGKMPLTGEQRQRFREILDIIVREQLWTQNDVLVKAADGGERTFAFTVGAHQGKFKLVNASPRHLQPFLTRTQELLDSSEQRPRLSAEK